MSGAIGSAAVGTALCGPMNSRFGRRPVIMLGAVVFVVGSLVQAAATQVWMLVLGRVVVGFGVGVASMVVPLFVAEMAPTHLRGTLVTTVNMFVTGGQFVAALIDGAFANVDEGWRYMLGLAAIPGAIQFVGFLFLPESPRWLVNKGRADEARRVLVRMRGTDDVDAELHDIVESVRESTSASNGGGMLFKALAVPSVRRAIFLGCGLQALQQLAG